MTIGQHLDELRACLIRSIIALVLACIVCVWPARYLLELMARPVILALRKHGQTDTLLATEPTEAFLLYVKVVLVSGLLLASPYIILQVWSFVASGLYEKERKWVYKLIPVSVGLFLAGVAFMYTFVLLASLNFLIGFGSWIPSPDPTPFAFEEVFLGAENHGIPATQPSILEAPQVPLLQRDPENPPVGHLWFNVYDHKLKLQGVDKQFIVQFLPGENRPLVTTHLRIGEYLSFVLTLSLAFGVAFQMPLVVVFLVRTGIMQIDQLRKYRRIVIFVIVVIAAALAPPDLLSHLLLSAPMILLFELGLLLARPAKRVASEN